MANNLLQITPIAAQQMQQPLLPLVSPNTAALLTPNTGSPFDAISKYALGVRQQRAEQQAREVGIADKQRLLIEKRATKLEKKQKEKKQYKADLAALKFYSTKHPEDFSQYNVQDVNQLTAADASTLRATIKDNNSSLAASIRKQQNAIELKGVEGSNTSRVATINAGAKRYATDKSLEVSKYKANHNAGAGKKTTTKALPTVSIQQNKYVQATLERAIAAKGIETPPEGLDGLSMQIAQSASDMQARAAIEGVVLDYPFAVEKAMQDGGFSLNAGDIGSWYNPLSSDVAPSVSYTQPHYPQPQVATAQPNEHQIAAMAELQKRVEQRKQQEQQQHVPTGYSK